MRRPADHLGQAVLLALPLCLLSFAASGQSDPKQIDPKQAVCQASWERCLETGGGKNWKPIYDRCLKARTACLGGRAYLPEAQQNFSSVPPSEGSGSDQANADPATTAANCENGQTRGTRSACVLAQAGEGYGQSFSLLGPGVPLARIQRASSVVKCAGGKPAMFYPNGRIQSCTLDNGGALRTSLTDTSGNVASCVAHALLRFDPEGRLESCDQP
ncbi:MAG TPA: hypothetical protein VN175_14155 [Rhizomicrobium sp.]|nr:hypothetical protein [Rhizomicrobium sp.]